jgi:hypothetical protein
MAKEMPGNQVEHFLQNCVTAQFLIDDLRRVSDYVGLSTVEELENLYWFKQHFDSGFALPKNLASGRSGTNESGSNLSFNIRSVVQDKGLGIGQSSGAWGIDIFSLRAQNVLKLLGNTQFNSGHFGKQTDYPMRCEHTDQVKDLRNIVRDRVLLTNDFGSIQETAEFFAINHLAAVIMVSEDRASGTQTKAGDHSYRQPFRRYVRAGSAILMDTGLPGPDSTVIVTHSTKEDIVAIRRDNPRWKALIKGIQSFEGFDSEYLKQRRQEFHADSSGKKGERSSSYYPELTDENLKLIDRNDPEELCREFYTWKIKS